MRGEGRPRFPGNSSSRLSPKRVLTRMLYLQDYNSIIMRKIFYIILFLTLGTADYLSAQMLLFKGSFDEALKKAQSEKKDLFVDFYADWCGPCKMMSTEVFTRPEVGEYFNARFVCVQIDADAPANKTLAKKYNVTALPTMIFISREGKEMRRIQGALDPESFLQEARIATGEELSFEQLYEKYKKNKKDFKIQQQLLMEAPMFILTQKGYNRQKWGTRIENLFQEYWKNKKLENMVNATDFYILTQYHPQMEKVDPIFDFVLEHHARFVDSTESNMGKDLVTGFLINLNNSYIIQLCRKGDLDYKERLKRVNGDMKKIYSLFSFGSLSVVDAITLLADATYNLYRHNDELFFENMNKYFAGKGEQVTLDDYTQALESLAAAYGEQMSEKAYGKSIAWISNALEIKDGMTPELRTRLLIMLGQCFQKTGNQVKAKQSLNQAFLASAEIENKMRGKQLQEMIQQMLQGL